MIGVEDHHFARRKTHAGDVQGQRQKEDRRKSQDGPNERFGDLSTQERLGAGEKNLTHQNQHRTHCHQAVGRCQGWLPRTS